MSNIMRHQSLTNKKNYGFTDREINWIWRHSTKIFKPPSNTSPSFDKKSNDVYDLINNSQNPEEILNSIKYDKAMYFIEQKSIEWIKKDNDRLLIIVINYLWNNVWPISEIYSDNYSCFIDILDNNNLTKDQKENKLNCVKFFWSNIEYKKNTYNWINKSDLDQIEWAWDYLRKTNQLPLVQTPPINQGQRYEYILAALDLIHFLKNQDAHELFLIKMKKTWSQKKYRDNNKIKTPHHLPLSKISHGQLKELSEILNRSISGTLELIIEDSYSKHILDHQGKKKY